MKNVKNATAPKSCFGKKVFWNLQLKLEETYEEVHF